ncbi:hypothetical protein BDZ97DRAFT_596599 [Flammula alnicola]|nr:hypothetical protein BDZ97DRAFT_596599 [Flammula alnicola]
MRLCMLEGSSREAQHCLAREFRNEVEWERETRPLRKTGAEVIKECEGLGGTLQAIGAVLAACLSKEFLVAKGHLHTALNLSTSAQESRQSPPRSRTSPRHDAVYAYLDGLSAC